MMRSRRGAAFFAESEIERVVSLIHQRKVYESNANAAGFLARREEGAKGGGGSRWRPSHTKPNSVCHHRRPPAAA